MIIAVDPGHGGPDPGAIGPTGLREADVNWAVAIRVNQYLQRLGHGVRSTRKEQECPTQLQRANVASGADCLVSIHANAHTNRDAHGMEVLVFPGRHHSSSLACISLTHLAVTISRRNRGIIHRTDLTVLREALPPAVLIELAFVSNPQEEELLRQDWFREKCALGISYAVDDFFLRRR